MIAVHEKTVYKLYMLWKIKRVIANYRYIHSYIIPTTAEYKAEKCMHVHGSMQLMVLLCLFMKVEYIYGRGDWIRIDISIVHSDVNYCIIYIFSEVGTIYKKITFQKKRFLAIFRTKQRLFVG